MFLSLARSYLLARPFAAFFCERRWRTPVRVAGSWPEGCRRDEKCEQQENVKNGAASVQIICQVGEWARFRPISFGGERHQVVKGGCPDVMPLVWALVM